MRMNGQAMWIMQDGAVKEESLHCAGINQMVQFLLEILTCRMLLNSRSSLLIIKRVCYVWTSSLISPSSSR